VHLHNVFFSLKDTSPSLVQALVDDCKQYLTVQDGIVSFSCGVREAELNRDVNDGDFDVSLHILFESRAEHDAYQDDGQHHVFVERNKDNWANVRVFDSVV
jgi:hypothetical protein